MQQKLQNANAGAGVVINNKKLLGIVTERDIVKALAMKKNNILTTQLKNIMTKKW